MTRNVLQNEDMTQQISQEDEDWVLEAAAKQNDLIGTIIKRTHLRKNLPSLSKKDRAKLAYR